MFDTPWLASSMARLIARPTKLRGERVAKAKIETEECVSNPPICFQPHVARDVISQPPPLEVRAQQRSRAEDDLSHMPCL
jgi:hypothetical protein